MNFPLSYYIYNPERNYILPDGKKYYNEIKYLNCDYLKYFQQNSQKYISKKNNKEFFFSNYEKKSFIKTFSDPLVVYISNKYNLGLLFINKTPYYVPNTILLDTIYENYINKLSLKWSPKKRELWFLKKGGDLTYGGFDVFPIIINTKKDALKNIEKYIEESNKNKKYYSDKFVLQRGIENPLLNDTNHKFDLRVYGLIVKVNEKSPREFYLFKKYLKRSALKPYENTSNELEVMLTNTTQAKNLSVSIEEVTTIGDLNNDYPEVIVAYCKMCNEYLKKLEYPDFKNPVISIIGLDYILDEQRNVYLLEINKLPAIHCDRIKREKFHKNLENDMFDNDFYEITFESILRKKAFKNSTKNYYHVK